MLRVLLFFLIFGPKLNNGLDVIPLTCALAVLLAVIQPGKFTLPGSATACSLSVLGLMSLLICHAIVHHLHTPDPDPYQILRFGRIIINFIGVLSVLRIYLRYYGVACKQIISRHVFDCLVIHAGIMFLMFISEEFRNLIYSFVALGEDEGNILSKQDGRRISGLALSWDALSGLQSLGLLLIPPMITRDKLSPSYAAIAAPLLLFSVCISGRTGIVTTAVLLPVAIYFSDLRRISRGVLLAGGLLAVLSALALGPFYNTLVDVTRDTSIGRVVVMFDPNAGNSKQANDFSDTIDAIFHHYVLPNRLDVLLWGTGRSGRDPSYFVPADNGLILNLHNLGIFAWLVMYGMAVQILWLGWLLRDKETAVSAYCTLSVLLVLMIDTKISFLYARNGFSVMMMMAVICWWRIPRNGTFRRVVPGVIEPHMQRTQLFPNSASGVW